MREIPSHKICAKCKEIKPASAFQKQAAMRCGLASWCYRCSNVCGRATKNKWRRTDKAKQTRNEQLKLYWKSDKGKARRERIRQFNQDKLRARDAVRWAIQCGKLFKPNICQRCNELKKIEAHHYLGYEKEHWLDVQWYCFDCHRLVDAEGLKEK